MGRAGGCGTSITDVPPLTLAEVEDELYSLTPAEFIAVRDERAREARAAGQRDLAAAVKRLGRPTAGAWLVNQLGRAVPEQMNHLFEVAEALQEAQRTLAGDRLRELSADRRRAIADLLPEASKLAAQARQPASAAVLGEVRATLEAAVADPEARAAVRSGRLTKAVLYAGLGEVDLSAALAATPQRGGTARAGRAAKAAAGQSAQAAAGQAAEAEAGGAAQAAAGQAAAARAERAAEREASAANAALEKAEREVTSLEEQRQFLRRRLDHLEHELAKARADDEQLDRQAKQARDRADQARASAAAAAKALGKLRKPAS